MSTHSTKLVFAALLATLFACSDGKSGDSQITPTITVSLGADQTIAKGLTHTFTAIVSSSDGATRDCTADAVWESSAPTIASVDAGVATGLAVGAATISATCSGVQASVQLAITDAELVGIDLSTSDAAIPVGADTRFTATGTYTDGSTSDLTAAVTWSSSDPGIARISSEPGSEGVATGVAKGTATVRADAARGLFATTTLDVTDAVLTSLAVQAPAPIPLGLDAALVATGHYSDGTDHDLTDTVTWSSEDEGVVTVSNAGGTRGLATGVGQGTATVRADATGGMSATVSLQVTDPVLVSVAIRPVAPIAIGLGAPLVADGTYSDGNVRDLSGAVTWTSSDETVVTVSNTAGTEGLATAVGQGVATVRAEAAGGISGTASLRVVDAVLTSVTVQSVAPIALGLGASLAATGHYSDGSQHDLTDAVTWASADESVITVSNATGAQGFATGVGLGTATVTATSASGPAGSVEVTVTAAQLVAIDVTPIAPTILVATTLPLAAIGTYSDDSAADLTGTSGLGWASSDPGVVSVDAVTGVAVGVAPGSATVTATDLASGLSASTLVTVEPPTLVPALSYLSLSRGAILGGGTVTGTVVLTAPAESDLIVALSSGGENASVPATVVIPAGTVRATFEVTTSAPTKRKVRVTISASYDGVTKIANLNVRRPH